MVVVFSFLVYNKCMKSFQKDLKNLLNALNIVAEERNVEYKMIYEYRYKKDMKRTMIQRKIVAFLGKNPICTKWFKNDLEVIQYLSNEFENYRKVE